ncbi:hypothetical protein BU24DRAFT_462723 [Aaosphaeria arxii CBS 175.79]|uniref:Mitochondrial outer membrane translocase complex, subunit Tom5 n=1 Tax=Aaosphaeria arxii CBS 175.79 TaxID=1450172 RepID=A0A6A5XV40_9PLEO|nr:uncharacterized protein BU24DRAFT_462723 [Aaosphaeria arxii CBS 175.79]KAF2016581.1 hypothetical protein BU24DRAFT_462723 [Aaosphaeria arxii CBS 175.79]
MFGGPPPPPSKQELEAAEAQTASDVRWTAAACLVLYLSPFVIEYTRKLV